MKKKLSLNDLPDKNSDSLSEQWSIAITPSMKRDIQEIETIHNKNMRKFIRGLIHEAIQSIKDDNKAS